MEQLPFEAWVRRGNLEHAKITALPRAFPPKNRRRKTIARSRRHFGRASAQLDGQFRFAVRHHHAILTRD